MNQPNTKSADSLQRKMLTRLGEKGRRRFSCVLSDFSSSVVWVADERWRMPDSGNWRFADMSEKTCRATGELYSVYSARRASMASIERW